MGAVEAYHSSGTVGDLSLHCHCHALSVEIIANSQGNRTTPTYVAFTDIERLTGDAAKNQVAMNLKNTAFDSKSLIGHKFTDTLLPKEISSMVLMKVKETAESDLGKAVVPAQLTCSTVMLQETVKIIQVSLIV